MTHYNPADSERARGLLGFIRSVTPFLRLAVVLMRLIRDLIG